MARLNGSLPVVELPSYYDFSSALQIEERTHLAVSVILLYEYCESARWTNVSRSLVDKIAASSNNGSRGMYYCCLHLAYFVTCPNHVFQIEFIWKKRWKPSSVLYIFVRYFGTLYNL
ncbi:hypothetical protein V8B97DRAFT_27346 [Scleroderma yunnanense]